MRASVQAQGGWGAGRESFSPGDVRLPMPGVSTHAAPCPLCSGSAAHHSNRPVAGDGYHWYCTVGPLAPTPASPRRGSPCATAWASPTARTARAWPPSACGRRQTSTGERVGRRVLRSEGEFTACWLHDQACMPMWDGVGRARLTAVSMRSRYSRRSHWHGYDPTREAPLKDPTHPFNTVYKHAASQVLNGRRGRLLPVS